MKRSRYKSTAAWILLATAPLLMYSNCSSDHEVGTRSSRIDTTALLSSLRSQKNSILSSKCSGCHNANATDTELRTLNTDFLAENDYINPGSPQTSPLYLLVIDRLEPPQGSPELSDYEINILRDWIAAEGGNFDTYIGGDPIDDGSTAEFTQVRAILTQHCTNCHRAGGDSPRLDVDAATLRGSVYLGRNLVIPNNAAGSLLVQSFSSMPEGQPLGLNSAEANVVRAWINNGAR